MVKEQILSAAGTKRTKGEDDQAFLSRVVEDLAEAPQEKLDKLEPDASKWMSAATEAYNAEKPIPDFPSAKKSKKPKAEAAETAEAPAAKKSKKPKAEAAEPKYEEVEPTTAKKSKKSKKSKSEPAAEGASEEPTTAKKSKKSKKSKAEPAAEGASEEPTTAKKSKKSKKSKGAGKNEGRGQGLLLAARKAVIESPDMKPEDIAAQILQSTGAELALQTARAVRYHTRQTLIALGALGFTMTSKRGKGYDWPA